MNGKKVLVFDDEQDIREIISYNLHKAGFEVISFDNPLCAYNNIQAINPDIILSDWLMPDMNGIELCQKLKNDYLLRKIPLIMISCKAEKSDKDFAFETGVDDYMTKPFRVNDLVCRINRLIDKKAERIFMD